MEKSLQKLAEKICRWKDRWKKRWKIGGISTEKVGVAVGVTEKLTSKYDAVKFVKTGSEILGGKGGGGRSDFAQAGGVEINKIDEAFEKLKSLI